MTDTSPELSTGARFINTLRTNSSAKNSKGSEFRDDGSLYDQGCEELFRWLTSGDASDVNLPEGTFPRGLVTLMLNNAHMGDAGFRAFVTYLENLRLLPVDDVRKNSLTTINLRVNDIVGNRDLAHAFVSSLSFPSLRSSMPSSSLSVLILSNNPLSASFKTVLFSLLPKLPSLRHLGLSKTGLTTDNALALALYIKNKTHPCRLTKLDAEANHMKYRGVRAIIVALQHCRTMLEVGIHSNDVEDPVAGEEHNWNNSEEGEGADGDMVGFEVLARFAESTNYGWAVLGNSLDTVLTRNKLLKLKMSKEALLLLKYSRLMLQKNMKLNIQPPTKSCDDSDSSPQTTQRKLSTNTPEAPMHSPFTFTSMPIEIQLHILSLLVPNLSPAQRIQIFEYAVDPNTLPSLSSLSTEGMPDLENLNLDTAAVRQTMREKWLARVGCDAFDPGAPTSVESIV